MQTKITLKKYNLYLLLVLLYFLPKTTLGQENNIESNTYEFSWNRISNNVDKFDWKDGQLEKSLINVNNSNVDIDFALTGETNTLCKWPYSKTTRDAPAVGNDANGENNLQFYTNGFYKKQGVTITINFSKPLEQISFNLLHVNKSYKNGDKFIIKGITENNKEIVPKFISASYPSYKTYENGIVDAKKSNTGDKAQVGVEFSSTDKIKSIKIQWKDCDTCYSRKNHGFGMSGLTFSVEKAPKLDSDNDGISDDVDIDDDNDGILDEIESKITTIPKGTAIGSPLFTVNNGVSYSENIIDGINYKGAKFDRNKDELVINLGKKIPANTYIRFKSFASGYNFKALSITESNASGTSNSNKSYILHYGYYGCFPKYTYYKLKETTQYLKIEMVRNFGGSIVIDYMEHQSYTTLTDIDTDKDGIPNRLDLDSDNDGCSDAVESCVPDILVASENTEDYLTEAYINGSFGKNGFSNNLENSDDTDTNPNFRNAYHYALDKDINACGIPMITQVFKSKTDNSIEITNIHPTAIIPANAIVIALFSNAEDNLTKTIPKASTRNSEMLNPGESLVIQNSSALITLLKGLPVINNSLTNSLDNNSLITTSRASGNLTWESRIDVSKNFDTYTSYVRIDEVTKPNRDYIENEWVVFVNNNLNPYKDLSIGGPERHPHAPLLTEVITANPESNTLLGLHRILPTERINGAWSNGYPDRSRYVIIKEDYKENNTSLKVRKLKVENNSTLVIDNNNLLIVSDDINLPQTNDEIRLAGSSELIQVHKDFSEYAGLGKVLIDRKTAVASIYRYSYLSSPVNTIGKNNYAIADVLKDGTNPLSMDSNIVDINFVSGFDGSATSPISIADNWIYTFSSSSGTRSNYVQKRSTGIIKETSGFLIKGTGVKQNYTFVGSPKDGNLATNIGAEDSYLVGNPYPSAISAKKFIEDNINSISGTLYFWQHAGEQDIASSNNAGHTFGGYVGGYATRNIAMGIAANQVPSNNNQNPNTPSVGNEAYVSPGNYIPVGTGFFIGGSKTGGPVVFNNSQREFRNNEVKESVEENTGINGGLLSNILDIIPIIDFKDPNELPIIKLGMDYKNDSNVILHRQIGISFNENNSFSNEVGYDSELFDQNTTDFYFKFEGNETKYSIAGVQNITSNLEVPLELIMNYDGEITIQLDEVKNVDSSIYLTDKVTGAVYDLSENATLTLNSGTYSNRFYLTFSNNESIIDSVVDVILPENLISFYYNSQEGTIDVNKEGDINITKIGLYKIFGSALGTWDINKQKETYKLNPKSEIKNGLYIVKLDTDKGAINKKIVVKR
ncbi:hypothetical protein H9I45_04880 [Polaribacter haliotis]|uniref:Uncharacterized protein n=1 Tax=Polaribacter haliotis TaxID=1888915 RepID=A0A7L8AIE3_9FLAO|nr:hypothetical protein [Polaribacter haliotis]QOD61785.1 hypothetical protein H9I45_04880 [Polaribacter haliotis]